MTTRRHACEVAVVIIGGDAGVFPPITGMGADFQAPVSLWGVLPPTYEQLIVPFRAHDELLATDRLDRL